MPVQNGVGTLSLPLAGVSRIVLVISPLALDTTVPGSYSLSVTQGG
jgi:hypothetical protein